MVARTLLEAVSVGGGGKLAQQLLVCLADGERFRYWPALQRTAASALGASPRPASRAAVA